METSNLAEGIKAESEGETQGLLDSAHRLLAELDKTCLTPVKVAALRTVAIRLSEIAHHRSDRRTKLLARYSSITQAYSALFADHPKLKQYFHRVQRCAELETTGLDKLETLVDRCREAATFAEKTTKAHQACLDALQRNDYVQIEALGKDLKSLTVYLDGAYTVLDAQLELLDQSRDSGAKPRSSTTCDNPVHSDQVEESSVSTEELIAPPSVLEPTQAAASQRYRGDRAPDVSTPGQRNEPSVTNTVRGESAPRSDQGESGVMPAMLEPTQETIGQRLDGDHSQDVSTTGGQRKTPVTKPLGGESQPNGNVLLPNTELQTDETRPNGVASEARNTETIDKTASGSSQSTSLDYIGSKSAASSSLPYLLSNFGDDQVGDSKHSQYNPIDSSTEVNDEIATSLKKMRFGIAYYLASCVQTSVPSRLAVLMVAVNYIADDIQSTAADLPLLASRLREELAQAFEETNQSNSLDPSYFALIACAALAPARIAPGGPVAQLLLFVEPFLSELPSLRAIVKKTSDVSLKGIRLPVELLQEEDTLDKWTSREQKIIAQIKLWHMNMPSARHTYEPANTIWREILSEWESKTSKKNGRASIGQLFKSVLNDPRSEEDFAYIDKIVNYWTGNSDKEIDRIDKSIRGSKARRIEASARSKLQRQITEALSLIDRWRELAKSRPDQRPKFHEDQAQILKDVMSNEARHAITELKDLENPLSQLADDLLSRYARLFDASATLRPLPVMTLDEWITAEILLDPSIPFNEHGRPVNPLSHAEKIRALANSPSFDIPNAVTKRVKYGDFVNADRLIEFLRTTGILSDRSAETIRNSAEVEEERFRSVFSSRVKDTSDRLDAAFARGVLLQQDYEHLRSQIPTGEFAALQHFAQPIAHLEEIALLIEEKQEEIKKGILLALAKLESCSPQDKSRVKSALDSGRFLLARDFLERLHREESLPELRSRGPLSFDSFFPTFVENYRKSIAEQPLSLQTIAQIIRDRGQQGPVHASKLSKDMAEEGATLIDRWRLLKESPITRIPDLRDLLTSIGFEECSVRETLKRQHLVTNRRELVFRLQAKPIASRQICQLPDFGSIAKGEYRIIVLRNRTTHEAIIRESSNTDSEDRTPTIVIFLNSMDVTARRLLASDFRSGRYRPTLVLDEALAVYVSTVGLDALGTFFECASAFAFAQPFDPDATRVPPEIFVGRADARRAILASSGEFGEMTHLVYGGRRLGKTVLLKNIAHEDTSVRGDKIVIYINLKATGIGQNRGTDQLWSVFKEHIARQVDDFPKQRGSEHPDSYVVRGVRLWLQEPDRRMLLLIDEADAFLEMDGSSEPRYQVLEQIKALMDETERRFKVVFAGLHNVQRAARDPNTPFAHLGTPIAIGPMLPESDYDELEILIRGPLEALGYRFESSDAVARIAAETNYYPALVQQFCKDLLRTLRQHPETRSQGGPPYLIPQSTVDRVFNSRETRNRIRSIFSWTIQLDPRYEFLTYLIARTSLSDSATYPMPVAISAIRDQARSEWPVGFAADDSFWMFECLLEEMKNLGILRESGDRQYAIRTRNLRVLLGSDDEIERRFNDAKSRRPPPKFEQEEFRRDLKGRMPSSLTYRQEDSLLTNGREVVLVFGTRMAGLGLFMDSISATKRAVKVDSCNVMSLPKLLESVSQKRVAGVHMIVVDCRSEWDSGVIQESVEFLAGLASSSPRIVRPVFLCGPKQAWHWLFESQFRAVADVRVRDVWLHACSVDYARTWLRENESVAYGCLEGIDNDVDAPWPIVAAGAIGSKGPRTLRESIDMTIAASTNLVSDVLISAEIRCWFKMLLDFGEAIREDELLELAEFENAVDAFELDKLQDFLKWSEQIGVVHKKGDAFRLDSAYMAGLRLELSL